MQYSVLIYCMQWRKSRNQFSIIIVFYNFNDEMTIILRTILLEFTRTLIVWNSILTPRKLRIYALKYNWILLISSSIILIAKVKVFRLEIKTSDLLLHSYLRPFIGILYYSVVLDVEIAISVMLRAAELENKTCYYLAISITNLMVLSRITWKHCGLYIILVHLEAQL